MGPFPAGTGRCRPLRERFARSLPVTPVRDAVMTAPGRGVRRPFRRTRHFDPDRAASEPRPQGPERLLLEQRRRVVPGRPGGRGCGLRRRSAPKGQGSDPGPGNGEGLRRQEADPGFGDHQRLPRRTRRGRHSAGDARSGRPPLHRSGSGCLGSGHGQVRLRGGDGGHRPTHPAAGVVGFPRSRSPAVSRSLHRQAALWGILHRDRSRR